MPHGEHETATPSPSPSFLVLHHGERTEKIVSGLATAARLVGRSAAELLIAIEEEGIFEDGIVTIVDFTPPSPPG